MDADRQIDIMGIVNLTDDSYFAPSRCANDLGSAMEKISDMISQGASIIDIGACSTRPGSEPVGAEVEWSRICPVLASVVERFPDQRVSVDTYHASVVERAFALMALSLGETKAREQLIVNDISAGEDDPSMLGLVGRLGLVYIAMHKRGTPMTMQSLCDYDDVMAEVREYFDAFAIKAESNGIKEWILDPGFGFAKTVEQNLQLLAGMDRLTGMYGGSRRKILAGVSRKSMIYRYLDITPEESLPATQVLHLKALQCGADILRVHDVAEAVRTVALYRVLR